MPQPALTARLAKLSLAALTGNRPEEAESFCRLGLMTDPEAGVFHHHLGLAALLRDDAAAALPLLAHAVEAYGEDSSDAARDAWRDLIVADLMAGHGADAFAHAFAAERRWPADPAVARLMAQAAETVGDIDTAAARYARALENLPPHHPDRAEVAFSLGTALYRRHRLSEAAAAFRQAIDADPRHARAWCNLGNALSDAAHPAEALRAFETALAIDPAYRHAHGNALHALHYLPGQSAASLLAQHRAWARQHFPQTPPRPAPPKRRKRLRVGLVSEDMRRHPVGYFCAGWMPHARAAGMDVVVYSSNADDDSLTEALRETAAEWHAVAALSDDALAALIRDDPPDVLIDLAGHTGRNRLAVFAARPAALQATWAGYVGTTGLAQIDGLIADRVHVPQLEEAAYVEEIWRMPAGYVCYAPPDYAPAPAGGAARRNGYVSFAAFHNPSKINPDLIAAWAKILAGVPESRLRLIFRGLDDPMVRDYLERTFQAHGIPAARLDIRGKVPHEILLGLYNDCDFALDSFPYAGGLTTLEALWMGIPVIAAPGATFASRHSTSHLTFGGFAGEVTGGPGDYVRTAIAWAHSPAMLDADRTARRARFATSPLLDGARFAADLKTLLETALAKPR